MNMLNIAKRNIRLFFRDRTAVFFSLLTVFIIIGLYVLFLGDLIAQGVGDHPQARFLVDSWIVAGLVASCSVTATLGAYGIIVDDNKKNIIKDFKAAPVKYSSLAAGYIISAFVIGCIMSTITLFLGQLYIVMNGGSFLPIISIIKVLLVIILSTFMNSAVLFFFILFIKSESAYGTLSTIIGTIIGFLMGIYIPIGSLPSTVQSVVKIFPGSYSVSLFRNIIMERPLEAVFGSFLTERNNFELAMGINFSFDGKITTPTIAIIVMLLTGIIFFILSILKLSMKKK